jgi:hypothetical protein
MTKTHVTRTSIIVDEEGCLPRTAFHEDAMAVMYT